jgi:hypothetical protein
VETVAVGGNCLFLRFFTFVAFWIVQNNMQLHVKRRKGYKIYMERNGVYDGNVGIITVSGIYVCQCSFCIWWPNHYIQQIL